MYISDQLNNKCQKINARMRQCNEKNYDSIGTTHSLIRRNLAELI